MEPLLKDHPGVSIRSEVLRHAIKLAKKSGKPGYTLCYNLLPGVFTLEEIATSRGQGLTKPKARDLRKPLEKERVAAIKVIERHIELFLKVGVGQIYPKS